MIEVIKQFLIIIRDYEDVGCLAGDEPGTLKDSADKLSELDIFLTKFKIISAIQEMEAQNYIKVIRIPGRHKIFSIKPKGHQFIANN